MAAAYIVNAQSRAALRDISDRAQRMGLHDRPRSGPPRPRITNRLDDQQQRDVRHLLTEHLSGLAETSGDDVLLPAEVRIVVAEKHTSDL